MKLSIVVPVYNEVDSIVELAQRIADVARQHNYDHEILLIDDGSKDGSWSVIEQLARQNSRIRGVQFRRNFGKAAALSAGFERAKGDFIITMDADLQDDPSEIPNLLSQLLQGLHVVSGWKKTRHDPWHKVLPSRVFNRLVSLMTGVNLHDHNCGLKAYRAEVIREINLYGEMHRFIPVLAAAKGFRVGEVEVLHHERKHGASKYGVERFVKGFLDLMTVYFLTGYGNRPQHLLGSFGLISSLAGACGLVVLSLWWALSRLTALPDLHLHQKAIFYFCILGVLLGIQLISIGFLAELITAMNRPNHCPYSIAKDTTDQKTSIDPDGRVDADDSGTHRDDSR